MPTFRNIGGVLFEIPDFIQNELDQLRAKVKVLRDALYRIVGVTGERSGPRHIATEALKETE